MKRCFKQLPWLQSDKKRRCTEINIIRKAKLPTDMLYEIVGFLAPTDMARTSSCSMTLRQVVQARTQREATELKNLFTIPPPDGIPPAIVPPPSPHLRQLFRLIQAWSARTDSTLEERTVFPLIWEAWWVSYNMSDPTIRDRLLTSFSRNLPFIDLSNCNLTQFPLTTLQTFCLLYANNKIGTIDLTDNPHLVIPFQQMDSLGEQVEDMGICQIYASGTPALTNSINTQNWHTYYRISINGRFYLWLKWLYYRYHRYNRLTA